MLFGWIMKMGKSLRWELTEKSNKIFHVNCFTSNRGGYFASILATMKKVRACQRIEEGEEILVSYYTFSDFPLRQDLSFIISCM